MKTIYYAINLDYQIYQKKFLAPIYHKYDLLIILTNILEYILTNEPTDYDEKGQFIILEKSHFSRVFIKKENKIFSINFPFDIIIQENQKITFSILGFDIELSLISRLRTVFINLKIFENEPQKYKYDYLNAILGDNDDNIGLEENEFPLLFYLLTIEDGYIRYDFDEKHENGKKHPLHHYDIFYHQQNTFKIGLYTKNNFENFRLLLDNTQNRLYIENKEH